METVAVSSAAGHNGGAQIPLSSGAVEVVRVVTCRHCIFFVFAIHGGG